MLGTIEEELEKCRQRFIAAKTKVGDLVWNCHHSQEIEILTEPPENRIAYILEFKFQNEQAQRFHEFRPVLGKLPIEVIEAYKARVEAYKAWFEADKARVEAYKAWVEVIEKHQPEITALHLSEVPDTTWNGKTIKLN